MSLIRRGFLFLRCSSRSEVVSHGHNTWKPQKRDMSQQGRDQMYHWICACFVRSIQKMKFFFSATKFRNFALIIAQWYDKNHMKQTSTKYEYNQDRKLKWDNRFPDHVKATDIQIYNTRITTKQNCWYMAWQMSRSVTYCPRLWILESTLHFVRH